MSERKPKRDLDERHALPVEDPEAALEALLKVDPEGKAKFTEKQVEKAVRDAVTDPDVEGPPPEKV
jgi:hypothetical protein